MAPRKLGAAAAAATAAAGAAGEPLATAPAAEGSEGAQQSVSTSGRAEAAAGASNGRVNGSRQQAAGGAAKRSGAAAQGPPLLVLVLVVLAAFAAQRWPPDALISRLKGEVADSSGSSPPTGGEPNGSSSNTISSGGVGELVIADARGYFPKGCKWREVYPKVRVCGCRAFLAGEKQQQRQVPASRRIASTRASPHPSTCRGGDVSSNHSLPAHSRLLPCRARSPSFGTSGDTSTGMRQRAPGATSSRHPAWWAARPPPPPTGSGATARHAVQRTATTSIASTTISGGWVGGCCPGVVGQARRGRAEDQKLVAISMGTLSGTSRSWRPCSRRVLMPSCVVLPCRPPLPASGSIMAASTCLLMGRRAW